LWLWLIAARWLLTCRKKAGWQAMLVGSKTEAVNTGIRRVWVVVQSSEGPGDIMRLLLDVVIPHGCTGDA